MLVEIPWILAVGTVVSWPLMSSAGKLINPKNHFRSTGELVPGAGRKLTTVLATVSLTAELIVVILVFGGELRLAGLILAPVVGTYSGFIVIAILKRTPVKCSCFIGLGSELGVPAFVRNVWLVGASLTVAFVSPDSIDLGSFLVLFSIGLLCLSLATMSEGFRI